MKKKHCFHLDVDRVPMKLRNNPFTKVDDTRPSFGSKPILREAKLSFTASQSRTTTLCSTSEVNLFSTNLSNGSSPNSIIKPENKGKLDCVMRFKI